MEKEPEILEELRRTVAQIRGHSRSRKALFPAGGTTMKVLSQPTTASAEKDEDTPPTHSFNAYVLRQVNDFSLLEEEYSLAAVREQLDHCQSVLQHFRAGQVRRGVRGKLANWVAAISYKILNWFITPSIMFDESVVTSLREINIAIDVVQKKIKVIAAELAALREETARHEQPHVSGKEG